MLSGLYKFGAWLLWKTAFATIAVALLLLGWSLRIYVQDPFDFTTYREMRMQQLADAHDELVSQLVEKEQQITEKREQLRSAQARAARASSVISTLHSLESRWERWFGDRERQDRIAAQISRVGEIETAARAQTLTLQREAIAVEWERQELQGKAEQIEARAELVARMRSPWVHYLRMAWVELRLWLAIGVGLYFFGATLLRGLMYFSMGPLVARGRALQFAEESPVFPPIVKSSSSLEVPLWPGEIFRVRRQLLRKTEPGVDLSTRLLLNWRFPLTNFFAGLSRLRELRHGHASGELRVSLGLASQPETEFSLVNVPDGGSLVVKPRFVGGVIEPRGQNLAWRTRWTLFHRQAWASGQFRFIELCGPCRVVIFGPPPLRVEVLPEREAGARPARRLHARSMVGFSPEIEYRRVRTGKFWRYLIGRSALLEALFVGPGVLVCHESASRPHRRGLSRGLGRIWTGMLYAFGL